MTTWHKVQVTFHRDDRDDAIEGGTRMYHGEDYDGFTSAAARERLVADGDLVIGPELVTFDGVIIPTARLDRVVVTIMAKGKPAPDTEPA